MADKIRKLNDDFCISDSLSEFTLPGNLPRGIKVFQAYNDTSTIVSFKVNENRCFEIAMAKESSSLKFRSSDGSGWTSWGGGKALYFKALRFFEALAERRCFA